MQDQPTKLPSETLVAPTAEQAVWMFGEMIRIQAALVDGVVTLDEYDERLKQLQTIGRR